MPFFFFCVLNLLYYFTMSNQLDPSSRAGVTLDLILKTFINSKGFTSSLYKNWEALSAMIPGTTPLQCSKRYEDLLYNKDAMFPNMAETAFLGLPPIGRSKTVDADILVSRKNNVSRSGSAKTKGSKEKESFEKESTIEAKKDEGPQMIIRVYDETKDVEQHFQCPRTILIEEMRYFGEYLSSDPQHIREDFDISVHCDVQIFDWLMKYAKRNMPGAENVPNMDSNNIISLLISSDFLKMDSLVQKCIIYCHKHMSEILRAPSNMNCINDKLVSRISDLFTHTEADDIKDKKDKFKSKIFAKKIERLFDASQNTDSLENASQLFRCSVCSKLLIPKYARRMKCLPSRLSVNKHGHIIYYHVPDTTFDINDYILQLKSQLCTWRNVYWRIWGTVNYLMCMRCEKRFPCYHLGHCDYHPEKPRFNDSSRDDPSDPVGIYPCCHKKVPRFNPTSLDKGCRVRDHIVNLLGGSESMPSSSAVTLDQIYNDLLSHREIVCVPYEREEIPEEEEKVNVFANEDFQKQSSSTFKSAFLNHNAGDHENKSDNCRLYNKLWFSQDSDFDNQISSPIESEDEVGDDEIIKVPKRRFQKAHIMVDPQNILLDTPEFQPTQKSLWNAQRSVRHNQDAQRQEDLRRMRDIVSYLTKLRLSTDKIEKSRKEHSGGVYTRIENQWKNNFLQMGKLLNQQTVRSKMRVGLMK